VAPGELIQVFTDLAQLVNDVELPGTAATPGSGLKSHPADVLDKRRVQTRVFPEGVTYLDGQFRTIRTGLDGSGLRELGGETAGDGGMVPLMGGSSNHSGDPTMGVLSEWQQLRDTAKESAWPL
jgi:hypothetical protein